MKNRGLVKIFRVLLWLISILIMLFILLGVVISFPPVQQSVIDQITNRYYKTYQKELSVGKFYLSWKGQLQIEDLFIEDMYGDTLANITTLQLGIKYWKLIKKELVLDQIELKNAIIKTYTPLYSDIPNFEFLLPEDTDREEEQERQGVHTSIDLKRIEIENTEYVYHDSSGGLFFSLSVGMLMSKLENILLEEKKYELGEVHVDNTHCELQFSDAYTKSESDPFNLDISARQLHVNSTSFVLKDDQKHFFLDARVGRLNSRVKKICIPEKKIVVRDIILEDPFYKQVYDIGYVSATDQDLADTLPFYKQLNWNIEAADLSINNGSCYLIDRNYDPVTNAFNLNNLMLSAIHVRLSGQIKNSYLVTDLQETSFTDGEKFVLEELSGKIDIDLEQDHLILDDLKLKTPQSTFQADAFIQGINFNSFLYTDVVKVEVKTAFISPDDLLYLPLQDLHINLAENSKVSLKAYFEKIQSKTNFRLASIYPGYYNLNLKGSATTNEQKLTDAQIEIHDSEFNTSFLNMILPDMTKNFQVMDSVELDIDAMVQYSRDFINGDLLIDSQAGNLDLKYYSGDKNHIMDYTIYRLNTYPLTGDSLFSAGKMSGHLQIEEKNGEIKEINGKLLCDAFRSDYFITDTLGITIAGNSDSLLYAIKSHNEKSSFVTRGNLTINKEGGELDGKYYLNSFSPEDHFQVSSKQLLTGEGGFSARKNNDSIDLKISIKELYESKRNDLLIADFIIDASLYPSITKLKAVSDSLNLSFRVDNAVSAVVSSISYYKSLLSDKKKETYADLAPDDFSLEFILSGYRNLISIFVPELKLTDSIHLICDYQNENKSLNILFDTPGIAYKKFSIGPSVINGQKQEGAGNLQLQIHELKSEAVEIPGISLEVDQLSTAYYANFQFLNTDNYPVLGIPFRFEKDSGLYKICLSNNVNIDQNEYLIVSNDTLVFNKSSLIRGDLEIRSNKHSVLARIDSRHRLEFKIDSISVSHIQQVFFPDLELEGSYSLGINTDLKDIDLKLGFFDLSIDSLPGVNGTIELTSTDLKYFYLSSRIDGDFLDSLKLEARYNTDNDFLSAGLALRSLNFASINSIFPELPADFSGNMGLQLELTGSLKYPDISGRLSLRKATASLKTNSDSYKIGDTHFEIEKNQFLVDDLIVTGPGDGELAVNGKMELRAWLPVFDIHIAADRFAVLNDSWYSGSRVFGQLFLNTDLNISGDINKQYISGTAGISEGTKLTLLKYKTLKKSNFDGIVNFKGDEFPNTEMHDDEQSTGLANLVIDLDFSIDPHSDIKYMLNQISNEYFQLEGNGKFKLLKEIDKDPYFTGSFLVEKGKMIIKPPIIPKKDLVLNKGGEIRWDGEITNPFIALQGYTVIRADARELLKEKSPRFISFKVYVVVSGTTEDLQISFSLDTDDTDGANNADIKNILNQLPEEERSRMATNLLLFGSITTKKSRDPMLTSSVTYANDFVMGQLNNFAREEIKFVDLDFSTDTYNSYHDVKSPYVKSVYHYSVSKRFLNNHMRIKVGGHVETEGVFNGQSDVHNVIGDLVLEYALDKNGYLLLKIFNNTEYEGVMIGEVTKTGVSIKLNRDINKLQQLFHLKDE